MQPLSYTSTPRYVLKPVSLFPPSSLPLSPYPPPSSPPPVIFTPRKQRTHLRSWKDKINFYRGEIFIFLDYPNSSRPVSYC